MAQIDVSDVLADPAFTDPVILIHRTAAANDFGQNVIAEQQFPTIGSVQPASGRTIQRLPEELRVANVSSFFLRGKIVADGSCKYPDVLVFRKERYQVQLVLDWTNWGSGWCEGTCVKENPT